MTSRVAIGLVTGALLLTISPLGAADHGPDELALEGTTIPEPIRPLGSPAQFHVNATTPCPDNGTAEARLELQAPEASPYVKFDSWDQKGDSEPTCSEDDHALDLQLRATVALEQTAPAFQPVEIPVVAAGFLNSTNESRELGPSEATVTVTPGYFNSYNVRVEERIQQGGPQEAVRYEIVIDNYSNGDTWFAFEVEEPVPDGFDVATPEPMLLNANATGGEQTSGTATLVVYTPANTPYTNENAAIQVNVTSYYEDEHRRVDGKSSELSTLTQARGVHVPGPSAGIVLVGLAAVALLARRLR